MKRLIILVAFVALLAIVLQAAIPEVTHSPKQRQEGVRPNYVSRHDILIPSGVEPMRIEIPKDAKRSSMPRTPKGTRGGRVTGDLLWEDNFEATADLWYAVSFSYGWMLPDGYGTTMYGMRFTPTLDGNLTQAYFYFYGPWTNGSPDLRVYVWENSSGLPGAELGHVDVPFANINLSDWTYVDLSSLGISVTEGTDFFIGYEVTNGDPGVTDIAIISDDGSAGEQRAVDYYLGAWEKFADWTIDCNLWLGAIIEKDPMPEPWTCPDGAWQLVEPSKRHPTSAHSPTHAWWVDDDTLFAPKSRLISPWVTVPATHSKCFLQFWYFNDFIDWDGDDDGSLDDYFKVYCLDDPDTCAWHTSTYNAWSGNSWWCGSENSQTYGTLHLYNLTSPDIDLGAKAGGLLTFKTRYEIEDPSGTPPPFDGWDVATVQISTDGWATYDFLIPTTPVYNVDTSYAFYANTNVISYSPGWAGSSGGWVDASFDLSAYSGIVQIRFIMASDPAAVFEGFFIDDVVVTDDSKAIVFQDDADVNVNLIPGPGELFLGDELTYDYWQSGDTTWVLEDNDQIWNGTLDISAFKGDTVKFVIEAIVDFDYGDGPGGIPDTLNGEGFWVDDVQIIGSNLPEYDMVADFCLVPYPTTVDQDIKGLLSPRMLIHQGGWGSSSAYCYINVEGVGIATDYYALPGTPLATDEYDLVELNRHPSYTPIVGTYNYIAWVEASGDTVQSNDTTQISIQINPEDYYELGYNSREWDGVYYTSTYCGTYFSPFTDGIFSTKDTMYVITAVRTLLINYGDSAATDVEGIEIYDANPDTTVGDLLYSENFNYTGGDEYTYEWAEFTLSSEVPVTGDFFVMIRGDWWDNPPVANYYPLFDNMIRSKMGVGAYYGHSFYYTAKGWSKSSGDRFINAVVERKEYLYPPANILISIVGNDAVLTWDPVSGANDYEVWSSTSPYSGFSQLVSTTFGDTTYTHIGAGSSDKLFYYIKAKSSKGKSSSSAVTPFINNKKRQTRR